MASPILEVKNLNVVLGRRQVIKDLSFKVAARETLVVLGPNGAGKTTLFKAILGLIPYQGEVKWHTRHISYLPSQELILRQISLPLTVEEFFYLKTKQQKEIVEILKQVGLDIQVLKQGFNTLSTGQFQRMTIAWALLNKPEVLLLDEPTSGVDAAGQQNIYSLLHKFWQKNNLTILSITHDLNIVWEHANNVLCLNQTNLCFGAPQKILTPQKLEDIYGTGIKFYEHKHD